MNSNDNSLSADVLQGAAAIADYIGLKRRTVYHAVARGNLPTFRIGEIVCARRSTLNAWIESQETAGRAAA